MAHTAIITTPFPTPEEVAKRYGISKEDQEFIFDLVKKDSRRSAASTSRRAAPRAKRTKDATAKPVE